MFRVSLATGLCALLLCSLGTADSGFLSTSGFSASEEEEDLPKIHMVDLSSVDYKPGKPLPPDIQALDGQRIELTGYLDTGTSEGVATFRLTFDTCNCNGAALQHYVVVTLKNDTISYTPSAIKVIGTISVGEEEEDGFVTSIFRFEAESWSET